MLYSIILTLDMIKIHPIELDHDFFNQAIRSFNIKHICHDKIVMFAAKSYLDKFSCVAKRCRNHSFNTSWYCKLSGLVLTYQYIIKCRKSYWLKMGV